MNVVQETVMIAEDNNPFEEVFLNADAMDTAGINPEQHFVHPHFVEPYYREDGTYVEGYWRDGDGDTDIDLSMEDGGGYMRTNPDDDILNNIDPGIEFDVI
ncbi:hypothetical protein [Paenibacillus tengchongensis]|uniref:hypothetical protein n=1 Tax=Paenibacillus tengchongensis TaxID=2608684 RepID=UPI001FE79ECF|nr:hypothetical protein [Paenibacillus tengchongensis]